MAGLGLGELRYGALGVLPPSHVPCMVGRAQQSAGLPCFPLHISLCGLQRNSDLLISLLEQVNRRLLSASDSIALQMSVAWCVLSQNII